MNLVKTAAYVCGSPDTNMDLRIHNYVYEGSTGLLHPVEVSSYDGGTIVEVCVNCGAKFKNQSTPPSHTCKGGDSVVVSFDRI